MSLEHRIPAELTDEEWLAEVARLAADERRVTGQLVAALVEVDTRRLLLDCLERGDLTLTTVCLLAPHLTAANVEALLNQTRGHSNGGAAARRRMHEARRD